MKSIFKKLAILFNTVIFIGFGHSLFAQNAGIPKATWQIQNHTPATHLVLIPEEVIAKLEFKKGDQIGGFTSDGICAGNVSIIATNRNYCLTLYGDDVYTTIKDGFSEGEAITIRIFNPENVKESFPEIDFNSSFPNQGFFSTHGISALKAGQLAIGTVEGDSELEFSIFPNPARSEVTISWNSEKPEQTLLLIYNAFGQVVKELKLLPSGAGAQQLTLDVSQLKPGTYSVTLKTGNRTGFKRIIIIQ